MKRLRVIILTTIILGFGLYSNILASGYCIERLSEYSEDYAVAGVWKGQWNYGYINKSGDWKIQPKYNIANDFHEGFAGVGIKKDKDSNIKYGYIKKDGTYLVYPKYNYISDYSNGYAIVGIGEGHDAKYGVIDKSGKIVIDIKYNMVRNDYLRYGIIRYQNKNNLYGMFIPKLNKKIQAKYNNIYGSEKYIITSKIVNGKEKIGLFFKDNGKIIEPIFEDIHCMNEYIFDKYGVGYTINRKGIIVEKDGKFGILDLSGNYIVDIKYDEIETIRTNSLIGKINGKKQILKLDGTLLINENYDDVRVFNWRSDYIVTSNGKKGILKKNGDYLVTPKYDKICNFDKNGYAKVICNGKEGIININGEVVLDTFYNIYTDIYSQTRVKIIDADGIETSIFADKKKPQPIIRVIRDGKLYYLNSDYSDIEIKANSAIGDVASIGMFEEGIAKVTKGDKEGYVRSDLTYIFKPIYDEAYRAVYEGVVQDYFTIKKGQKWGAVLMDGTVINPVCDKPPHVSNGIARCIINEKYRYIDKNNKFINKEKYKFGRPFSENKAAVQNERFQMYFIDKNGDKVSDFYQNLTSYSEGIAFAFKNNVGVYIDHEGKYVLGKDLNIVYGYPFINNKAVVISDNYKDKARYGILKRDGTWFIEPIFDTVIVWDGKYRYYLNDKEAKITEEGKIIWK
ncbi:MAG: WG repeat-containing protein [Vallitalea sp.]|jgi:hypothetical protein|nr:WG repeat-containing protein [Vallitalea sp.]